MDSLLTAAARALAAGDPLGALKRVALRDDTPALTLRGTAVAQLGDLAQSKALLRSAARAFGPKEAVACAKCVVAEAEIALVSRDLGWPAKALAAAGTTLEDHGDRVNAARYLEVRRLVLIGRLDEVERMLAAFDPARFPPVLRTSHELVVAGIAMRRLRTKVARLIARAEEQLLLLEEVEALLASKAFIGGACRHVVRDTHTVVSRARLSVVVRARTSSGRSVARRRAEDLPLARAFLRATRSGYDAITCR